MVTGLTRRVRLGITLHMDTEATSDRAAAMLDALKRLGHSQRSAAEAAGLHHQTIRRAIHNDPDMMAVGTAAALLALGLPAALVAPRLAPFLKARRTA